MDLNIIIENQARRDSEQVIEQKLMKSKMLGYHAVAVSVIVDLTAATKEFPQIPTPPEVKKFSTSAFKVYTRITAKVSETGQLYKFNKSKETSLYDLVALEPQNEKTIKYISVGSADLDILTLNLSDKIEYNLFKIKYNLLEERGVCIEINWGPAQLGQSLRRNIICNGQILTEKTTKNVILSSGVDDIFRIRGPADAKSIGTLFLMNVNKCHDAVFRNGKKAIEQAKHRANPASSAIELIKSCDND